MRFKNSHINATINYSVYLHFLFKIYLYFIGQDERWIMTDRKMAETEYLGNVFGSYISDSILKEEEKIEEARREAEVLSYQEIPHEMVLPVKKHQKYSILITRDTIKEVPMKTF